MNAVYDKLQPLINEELEAANKEHGQFNSYHEGYAVLLEEFEETQSELDEVKRYMDYMWGHIKDDNNTCTQHFAARVQTVAMRAAAEAIQVAAMALKIHNMNEDKEGFK